MILSFNSRSGNLDILCCIKAYPSNSGYTTEISLLNWVTLTSLNKWSLRENFLAIEFDEN
jgi:hypothetical protein